MVQFENREIWADLENRSKVVHSENFPIWRPASGDRDHVTHHVTSHVTHWGQWKYASRSWHAVGNHRRQLKLMYRSKISGRGPKHCSGSKFLCRPRPGKRHTGFVHFKSVALGRFELNFRSVIFKLILVINGQGSSCEIAISWFSLELTDDEATLVQVMAWCHLATSNYLSQCWPQAVKWVGVGGPYTPFLARWLTSARAYRIGGRKLCPSVCLYVKRYLLLQFCTDYNQTWINMIWAVAAKTLLSQIFHKWRKIEVNCVYISRCAQLVSYFWNAGMHTK